MAVTSMCMYPRPKTVLEEAVNSQIGLILLSNFSSLLVKCFQEAEQLVFRVDHISSTVVYISTGIINKSQEDKA